MVGAGDNSRKEARLAEVEAWEGFLHTCGGAGVSRPMAFKHAPKGFQDRGGEACCHGAALPVVP